MSSSIEIKSRLVIDAEGALPILLQKSGLRRSREHLIGLQYEMADIDVYSQDSVELYFGKDITSSFFAWVVPIGDRTARVGLCVPNLKSPLSMNAHLEKFLKKYLESSGRISDRRIKKVYAGVVPIGGAIKKTYADSVLVIGDAAGQVKSTSGGGIYFGLKAAKIAAETAIESLEVNDTSQRFLRLYETRWKSCIGLELRVTSIFRKILDSLTDDEIDVGFQIMSEENIIRIIEEFGDTAFQSEILKSLALKFLKESFKRPNGFTLLKKLFTSGLISLVT
jgi:flavin-dependent dehydrogenase